MNTTPVRRLLTAAVVWVWIVADPVGAGGLVVSGQGTGLYDGDELDEFANSLASILYVLLAAADDDGRGLRCGDPGYGTDCEDLSLSVPQAQASIGLGYALTRRLTVGARYLYRHDRRDNDIARLWGGGPEVSLDLTGHPDARPFVGVSLLFVRGLRRLDRPSGTTSRPLSHGRSLALWAGIRWRVSEVLDLVAQSGYQRDAFPAFGRGATAPDPALLLLSRGVTMGVGFRFVLP